MSRQENKQLAKIVLHFCLDQGDENKYLIVQHCKKKETLSPPFIQNYDDMKIQNRYLQKLLRKY